MTSRTPHERQRHRGRTRILRHLRLVDEGVWALMGAYPSADIVYGIDLGIEEDGAEWPWLTEELEEERGGPEDVLDYLLKEVRKVAHHKYGNRLSGFTGFVLCTKGIGVPAYDVKEIKVADLTDTVEDDRLLREAWAILYPDQVMPDPKWLATVSYG